MANTYVDYTAVASQTDYNFSFEYLRDDHVKVKVDDVIVTNYTIVTSPVQLIRFNTAPTGGAAIKIYRDSRGDFSPLVDFVDGSVLTESELDESYKHNLFVAQEASEGQGGEQLTKKGLTDYDAEGNKIINLGTPTTGTDAANKGYVDQTIDNAIALGGSPAIVSLGGYDVTALGTSVTKSLANWTNDLNSPTATGSTTARTLADRFGDVVNVLDYGVVADGVTDNTSAYTAMISAVAEGSTIVFPKGSYKGDFISSKSFRLQGNDSTIIPVSNSDGCFSFQGSLGSYASLSSAPAYGDITLSGVTGLTGDTLLSLYSGNQRPSDSQAVNYETVLVKSDGSVIDKIYSDQNGGTPTYAIITPLSGIVIDGFHFEMGSANMNGIYIRYAKDVRVSNISMNGGDHNTISIRDAYNATVDHVRRYKPTATGSGEGYNVGVLDSKYIKVNSVYGEGCRHDYDQDSTYVTEVNRVISVDAVGASVVLAHNSFGGSCTVTNCTVRSNDYAVSILEQGLAAPADGLFRNLKVDGVSITNNKDMSSADSYVGVYLQYPTEDVEIRNVNVTNANNPGSFDYAGSSYNNAYYVIRIYEPRQNCLVENVKADSARSLVWVDQTSSSSTSFTGCIIRNVSIERFEYVVRNNVGTSNGSFILDDIKYYSSSTIYGDSVFSQGAGATLNNLNIRGTALPDTSMKMVDDTSFNAPTYSHIETAGQVRVNSSLNALTAGGTITQYEYLSRGDFAIWGGSASITLDATTPIEQPVTRSNIFSIWNYHPTSILTIPGNSDTVTNTSDITIDPGERAFFQPDSTGDKWRLMAVMTNGTLSQTT